MYKPKDFTTGVLLLMVISGCRSYGGYSSEEATFDEIKRAGLQMETSFSRAIGVLAQLEEEATVEASLYGLVEPYREILDAHARTVEEFRARADALSRSSSYRDLNHSLGAMTAERTVIEDRYAGIFAPMFSQGESHTVSDGGAAYSIRPPHYTAVESGNRRVSVPLVIGQ